MKKSILILVVFMLSACRMGNNRTANPPDISQESTSSSVPNSDTPQPPPAESEAAVLSFNMGRNDVTINVDDTPREFILYVPSGYDPNMPTPVVVMCHGSNQHPNNMYENTGWVRKAEEETILVVFPASWKYPLLDEEGIHEKWNTAAMSQLVPEGTELKDDVKFMRSIIEDLKATFNVDEKRIFASGFSNGGGFVLTRLIPEMNDVFAAYGTAGAGLIGDAGVEDVSITIPASLYSMIGTNDNKIADGQDLPVPFPFEADAILSDPVFSGMLAKTSALLGLDSNYAVESQGDFTRFTYNASLVGADNEYIFMMIKGMFHKYPSGDDNPTHIDAADLFWDFFLKHAKP